MTAQQIANDQAKSDTQAEGSVDLDQSLKAILRDVLGLDQAFVADFTAETGLFGHLPELDSMAVAGLLTEVEDRLEILIEDDDVDGEMLETFGGLLRFVEEKLKQT